MSTASVHKSAARRPRASAGAARSTRHRDEKLQPSKQMMTRDSIAKWAVPAFSANLSIVFFLFVIAGGMSDLTTTAGVFNTLGRLSGLFAVNLCLVQLMLMGRNPWLDRTFGMDRLARWHRVIGHASFDLIVAHVFFIVIGYAKLSQINVFGAIDQLVWHTRDVLMATAAFACFIAVVVTSVRAVKRAMRYETWYYVHLYAYLGVALSVPHQIYAGETFASTPLAKTYWFVFYTATVGSLLWFRVAVPLRNLFRHDMRVEAVVRENRNAVSVYISGKNLHLLDAQAGQYFIWRFLCSGQWWQAHPYSLSAAPPDAPSFDVPKDLMRITVKDLGAGSGSLARLKPGTRVHAEGPYGAFTPEVRRRRRVLLIAGGVGITPIRALLESLPAGRGDITVIYRAREDQDLVLLDEVKELAARRSAPVHLILGSQHEYPMDRQPLRPSELLRIAPDLRHNDVYICGPHALTTTVLESLQRIGVPDDQIHHEAFAF